MSDTRRQRLGAALFTAIAFTIPAGYAVAQPAAEAPGNDGEAAEELQPAQDGTEEAATPTQPPAPLEPAAAELSAPPAEPAKEEDEAGEAGYDKGFYIQSADGKFSTKIQSRVQVRYTFQAEEGADGREVTDSNFSMERVRLTLGGNLFGKNVKYKFQTDFGKGFVALRDYYVDYKLSDDAMIRMGQWMRPFSRQRITSTSRMEFVDRSITDRAFKNGRDIGIGIQNDYEASPELEWALAVFNGPGEGSVFDGDVTVDPMTGEGTASGKFTNVPDMFGPLFVARAGINRGGIKGYSEADLEGGPLRFGVAASVLAELDSDGDNKSTVQAQLDYIVKVHGLSSSGAVYVATAQEAPGADGSDTGFADQAYNALGFHVQFGYMLAKQHQGVVRFAMIRADDSAKNQQELAFGYSLYKIGHNLQWNTDISLLANNGDATLGDAIMARSQLQLSF